MIIKNKKNGTNVLAFRAGAQVSKVIIRGGEQVQIPALTSFNQIVNKSDFTNRGWFAIIEEEKKQVESGLERAKREVANYATENKTEE